MNNNKSDFPFLMYAKELSQRCSKINLTETEVYSLMYDDYKFYMSLFNHYSPAVEDMAIELSLSEKTVRNAINKLRALGLVELLASGKASFKTNTYKVKLYTEVEGLLDLPPVKEQLAERRAARCEAHKARMKAYYSQFSDIPEQPAEEEEQEAPPEAVETPVAASKSIIDTITPEAAKAPQNSIQSVLEGIKRIEVKTVSEGMELLKNLFKSPEQHPIRDEAMRKLITEKNVAFDGYEIVII